MKNLTKVQWIILLCVLVAVSAFLPWISSPFGSIIGIKGNGILTLILSIVMGLILFFFNKNKTEKSKKTIKLGSIISGAIIFVIGAYPILTIGSFIGIGLYLTALAGAGMVAVNFIESLKNN